MDDGRESSQTRAVLEAGLGFVQKSIRGVSCGFSRSFRGTHFAQQGHSPRLELGCLLGAAALLIHLVLQGPQGAQRRLLGLGQTPDAGDVEPLVGPVATQGAQVFAAVHIPEPDGPIIAATGDSFAIGADLEGLHLPLMGFSLPQARSALQVPPAQPAITASTEQPIPDRMPGDCIEHTRQPLQGGQALPTVGIPHEELPALSATTTGGQPLPVWTPGHAPEVGVGVVEVPQDLGTGSCGWVPQPDAPTPPARGEQSSIGTPCHAVHYPCMAAQHTRRLAALHLPEADLGIGTDTGELFAIRTPVKIIEGARVSL